MLILWPAIFLAGLLQGVSAGQPASGSAGPFNVGVTTRRFVPNGTYDWRAANTHALVTTIWYPADNATAMQPQWLGEPPLLSVGTAAPGAAIATTPTRFPLVLLSHGTGGSSQMLAWLGTTLAAHGYVASAVNHPGNNSLEPYTAPGFLLWWQRAIDLSTVIDQMLHISCRLHSEGTRRAADIL